MKKILVRVALGLLVLIVLAIVAVALFLDSAVKKGVETVGPALTKVDVTVKGVSLSLLSGSGELKAFHVGNPEGYKSPSAIDVGSAKLAVQPSSLFADKIIVRTIDVQAPVITFETDLKGNNLSKILANIEEATGGTDKAKAGDEKTEKKANRKLQVDEFVISGGKVNVSVSSVLNKSATVPLPEIRLSGLGQGPEGITVAELSKKVLQAIMEKATQAAGTAVADLSKELGNIGKETVSELGKSLGSTGQVEKITRGVGDLFKKKKQ